MHTEKANISGYREILQGDTATLLEVLRLSAEYFNRLYVMLDGWQGDPDLDKLGKLHHLLKPSFAWLDLPKLDEYLSQLRFALKEDPQQAELMIGLLKQAMGKHIADLEAYRIEQLGAEARA